MSTSLAGPSGERAHARNTLRASAATWFIIAAFGQFFFAYYILVHFGGSVLEADWEAMSRRLIVGIVDGDAFGNFNLLLHLALAFLITVAGPLQFIPQIRQAFPVFHRWTGRIYLTVAVVISLGALYLTWGRGMAGLIPEIGISINAVLIIVFAGLALRAALVRRFDAHHRWALRLFIAASGVWFFRVGYGFWMIATGGAMPGVGRMLDGPVDYFLVFGCYGAPLVILEVYQYARDKGGPTLRYAAAGLVFAGAGITATGVVGAAMMFWLPRLAS
ncbi:MAG: DUF2306 domain-containing protein [Pseudomonadota bacterium]